MPLSRGATLRRGAPVGSPPVSPFAHVRSVSEAPRAQERQFRIEDRAHSGLGTARYPPIHQTPRRLAPPASSSRREQPYPVIARYRARDGTVHRVTIGRTPEGRWKVLDTVTEMAIVVETLTGHDDRQAQARALALDYAAEQQAFELGVREHHPLPRRKPAIEQEQQWAA